MSSYNETAKPNERGICFVVGETFKTPPTYFVVKFDVNDPRNKPGMANAIIASGEFGTIGAAEDEARRLTRESLT
jgi:hypothetical protein